MSRVNLANPANPAPNVETTAVVTDSAITTAAIATRRISASPVNRANPATINPRLNSSSFSAACTKAIENPEIERSFKRSAFFVAGYNVRRIPQYIHHKENS